MRIAAGLLLGVIVFMLIESIMPFRPYRAYCAGSDIWVDGPFRERFLLIVSSDLTHDGLPHLVYKGNIYPFAWDLSDLRQRIWPDDPDYHWNMDWKAAAQAGSGVAFDGAWFPPPPKLIEIVEARGERLGLSLQRDERGLYLRESRATYQGMSSGEFSSAFQGDCEVFKAAVLPDLAYGGRRSGPWGTNR